MAVEWILSKAKQGFDDSGFYNNVLVGLFRNHVQSRYPDSKHWNPDKITAANAGIGVEIDIPGAGRAWHDVDIYPKNGQWLTIPLHPFLVGVSARTQEGLFRPWKRGGGERMNVLAKTSSGGALVFMYALSKHVHQRQDPSLLPSDEQVFDALFEAYAQKLAAETGGSLS